MVYFPLLCLPSPNDYRKYYEKKYCSRRIVTFDNIHVRFRKNQFDHCFFESSKRNKVKDIFSLKRAQRIDWIDYALKDPNAELYIGWDNKRKRNDSRRRVAVVANDYVVVIRLTSRKSAEFVTAYIADSRKTIASIRQSPIWKK